MSSDEPTPTSPEEPRPQPPAPVLVPRWIQLVALPLLVIALYLVGRAAGPVLLIFVLAGVIALILNPVVSVVQRRWIPRGLAIGVVYLGFAVAAIFAGYLLANPIADQAAAFGRDVPAIIDDANEQLADLQRYFDEQGVDVEIKAQGEPALATLQEKVLGGTAEVVGFGGDVLERLVAAGFGLVLVVVLSVYMLLYGPRIGDGVRRWMPPGDGTPEDDFPTRIQKAVVSYLRGQALFSLAMGTGAGLGLWVFGRLGIFEAGDDYALVFALFFGFMELIPFVGPVLGALPPILVALFQDPLTAVWVGLLFLALQQIEGHVVAPYIFGHALRINPLLVIFALLLGGEVYGIIGALVALPLAAMLRETVVYLQRHLVLEPWGAELPLAVAQPPPRESDAEDERTEVASGR